MNINISEKHVKNLAFQVFKWAVDNGLFHQLHKIMIPVTNRIDNNQIIEFKIQEIGASSILRVFEEEATVEQLKSGGITRYFNESLELQDYFNEKGYNYFYLSNQWSLDSDNLNCSKLIDLLNSVLMPNYLCGIINKGTNKLDAFLFYIIQNGNVVSERSSQRKLSVTDFNNFERGEVFTQEELKSKFLHRLKTQNRPYSRRTGLAFYPSLLYKLDKTYFINWCYKQIEDIILYSETSKIIHFREIQEIVFNKNGLFYKLKNSKQHEKLYFQYKNEFLIHGDYVSQIKFLTIDHIKSMDSILSSNISEIPVIKKISDMVFKKYGIKQKLLVEEIDYIINQLTELDKAEVLKELDLISNQVELQLLPDNFNKSKK